MSQYQFPPIKDDQTFQKFSVDLFNSIYGVKSFQEYGRNGQKQAGIDVISNELGIVVQCKHKIISRPDEKIRRELIKDFEEDLLKIKSLKIEFKKLIFISTYKNDTKLQIFASKKSKELDFAIEYWGHGAIEDHVSVYKNLWRYFGVFLPETLNNDEVLDILKKYQSAASEHYSEINFIGYKIDRGHSRPTDKKLSSLFVEPRLQIEESLNKAEKKSKNNSKIFFFNFPFDYKLKDLWEHDSFQKSIAIIGEAGSGKSALINYIIYSLLNPIDNNLNHVPMGGFIPFKILLKDFAAKSMSVHDYIVHELKSKFSLSTFSLKFLNKIFKDFKVLIIFDGFDEIFDLSLRTEIKKIIETFLRLNPNVRSIVTSRQTSYIQRPLSSTYFNVFRLAEFDDAQISEYISKWYSSEISNVEKRNVELKLCQSEISDLPIELKSNPLFLSLIVILFRNSVKLPESKLELYESCTRTIVEHWDQDTKNIKFPIDITNKNNVFAHLAFWQYNLLSKKEIKEINHKDVEKVVSEFLMQWTDEREEAQRNAEVFLDFSANRSLYIENKFSHDTFLEYYTALDIFRRLESEGKFEERTKLVSRYINNPRWNIIFELLIPMIDRDVSSNNKLDALFITLLDRPSAQNQIFLLLNVANSITYISPKVKCNLIEKAINFVLDNVQIDVAGYKLSDNFQQVKSVYSAIVPLMNNSRYTIYFQKVFDEIGARIINIERKIKYFIFFFELMFHKNSKEDETVNKIAIALNDKRLLVDGLEKSHHLNLMYLLFEWYYNKNALFIDHLKVYIEKFGYDKLYTYCEFKFIYRVNLITYMNYICWELVFSNSIDTLIRKYANLSIYLKQKAILDNTSWVFLADQDYVHLRKLIMMCDNESLLEFLIALYGNGEKKKRNFEELQKLLDKHTKREFIMKLLK